MISILPACNSQRKKIAPSPEQTISKVVPKNIIIMIGDGMGMGQISAGTYVNGNTSSLERFPVVGIHKPACYDSLITDSAAGATAFACGVKTYYTAVGVDKDTIPVETLLEEAEKRNLKTGLVVTSTIVHATPASFFSHNEYRRNYEEIAEDILNNEIEYFVGGGKKFFDRREKDDRNILDELRAKGYFISDYIDDFAYFKSNLEGKTKVGYLSSDNDPLPVSQGRDYLMDASMTGIDFLSSQAQNGFFLMIEGSQIDWGGHANNESYILSEFKEFDQVIGKVLDWAEKDGETLVVVTADHETGGFTIQPGSTMNKLKTAFTTNRHSGDFIPVFAYGPGQELFTGLYENTEIYHKIRKAIQWQ